MSPSRSEPRTNPPKARSALIRSSSASLRSSSDSSAVNWLQSVSPSISMRNAMMRTRVTATTLFDVTLVLIIAFLMLIDGDTLWSQFTALLSEELRSEAELLRMSADRAFGGFVRGSLLLGLIYGVATLLILAPL